MNTALGADSAYEDRHPSQPGALEGTLMRKSELLKWQDAEAVPLLAR
jgi:hypothetical protein